MTYSEYVVQEFQKNFDDKKQNRMALFGSGEVSKSVLENCRDYNICCMFDSGTEKECLKYGKPLLNYMEIEKIKLEFIVVVARKKSTNDIYDLIRDICKKNEIRILDFWGNDLYEYYSTEEVQRRWNEYCKLTQEKLMYQIKEHEVISFDVFDTLVMRKVPKPDDIFELMEFELQKRGIHIQNFPKLRKEAERNNRICNPNIYEIYQYEGFKETGYSEIIRKLELEVEGEMLIRRESIVDSLRYANRLGKRVYLISDMYLPHDILQKMLRQLGITGYDKLYVSCDYRQRKSQHLYEIFKSEVPGKSYLHIGDNEDVDGICAEANSIDTFLIQRGIELYEKNSSKKRYDSKNDLGAYIAKEYNNPFHIS